MSDKHFISLDELIEADDREYEDVAVPEWGGWVRLQSLTKQEQLDIRSKAIKDGQVDGGMAELLALAACMVEPNLESEQIGVLRTKNAAVISRLMTRVAVLSGLDEETAAKEAAKKFPEGQRGEVHVHPGEGPGDDSQGTASEDDGS